MPKIVKPEYVNIDEFVFESGEMLNDLKVEYQTIGTPKLDSNGLIENAVLYLHGSSGDYSSIKRLDTVTGSGEPLNTDEFYIISPSSLGSPGSASPSSTSLGPDFPDYTIKDMVNFHHTFLRKCFPIKHLKGVIGNSMGGFQALTWGVEFPDFMDFLIILVSSYQVKGLNYANFYFTNSLIERDPDYKGGNYKKNPEKCTRTISEYSYQFGVSREYYRYEMNNDEIVIAMEEMGLDGTKDDANDTVWRNKAAMNFDLEDRLLDIKASTLIVGINQDQYFPPAMDAIPMSRLIKNSELIIYDSLLGHIGTGELDKVGGDIREFLDGFK
ncbi:alpha/beta fold hydrolase [Methanobacterium alcaliphilum]|uniref:alpha/beta fold hydrolase n=1 Tax=Methanobacterium alcaliphilum TaxID=392018 RepID=UPI00200B62A7|nr:alpha/beta fold hydrolase [Methanobacterium alcaliphilum]MCK9151206.1 alpha/beta fold hydrolase [Methanobacterium alcaliphilum]